MTVVTELLTVVVVLVLEYIAGNLTARLAPATFDAFLSKVFGYK